MSTFEGGTSMSMMSTIEGGGQDDSNQRSPVFLALLVCLLFGIAGGAALAATGSDDQTTPVEDTEEPGNTYVKGSPPKPPSNKVNPDPIAAEKSDETIPMMPSVTAAGAPTQVPATTKKLTTKQPPPTTKNATTTTIRTTLMSETFSVKALVCTVGAAAVVPYMMPPDGLCDYLYYVDLVVVANKLYAAETDTSWEMFQNVIKSRRKTKGGISFDIQYATANHFSSQDVINQLNRLAGMNIKNYGLLTALTHVAKLTTFMAKAKDVLQKLKSIQGNDPYRKTVLAMGLYDYDVKNAFEIYKAQFKMAVESIMADIVIAVSTTGMQENDEDCFAAPSSTYRPELLKGYAITRSKKYPDLKNHATLVSRNVVFKQPHAQMGLSVEIGTLFYQITVTNLSFANMPYAECIHSAMTHLDVWECDKPEFFRTIIAGIRVGRTAESDVFIYLWESEYNLERKLNSMIATADMRGNMVWLVNNVHMGDYTKKCEEDPFLRLSIIRNKIFNITDRRMRIRPGGLS